MSMMQEDRLLVFALLLVILATGGSGCASVQSVRSDVTMDSGRPMSAGLSAYDVDHYTLRHRLLIGEKAIDGSATIAFSARTRLETLELDFDGLFTITAVVDGLGALDYARDDAKLYIALREPLETGSSGDVTVRYHGQPVEAANPPWEGGFVWEETPSGKPWVSTAIQGEGCDVWWPCKDHPTGEPSGLDMYFTVPADLTAVANGVLVGVELEENGERTFYWRTSVPTNTYGVALNVAPYVLIEDTFVSSNGTVVPLKFWAIEDHEQQARDLFDREFKRAIEFFERKIGPYPWGQEKLGIVETSHLGMEHQTVNAYGNEFRRGEFGFDWLFHHELAHEWFGNVMTHATVSDMWLHEGFGAFMQPEYTREIMGEAAFHASLYQTYRSIKACNAIAPRTELSTAELYFDDPEGQGPGADIYSKGTWLLHSLRNMIGEQAFWASVRRLVYDTAEPSELQPPISARLRTTDDFMRIASEEAGASLDWFFEVYARRGPLPVLEAKDEEQGVRLSWTAPDSLDFPMPVPVRIRGEMRLVRFEGNTALIEGATKADILIDPYMDVLRKLSVVPTCEERRAAIAQASSD
jgi:aminopeptidase N